MSYADKHVSTAATLAGLQRKADILSAFTVLFDMELSPAKLRVAVFGPIVAPDQTQPSTLTIHGPDWTPIWVPLRTSGTIKMLGVVFDTCGPQHTQKVATKLRLARACITMCAQRRFDSAIIAASVSSLTRTSYTTQFTPWTSTDLPDLDIPQNKLFRRLSGNMHTFPTQLLYLPASMGGLGLRWTLVNPRISALLPAPPRGVVASGRWRAPPLPSYCRKGCSPPACKSPLPPTFHRASASASSVPCNNVWTDYTRGPGPDTG